MMPPRSLSFMSMKITAILCCLGLSQLFALAGGPEAADPLASGFVSPPASARPQTCLSFMSMKITAILCCLGLSQLFALAGGPEAADPLASGFVSPPASARPQTWWHWMNGNVTKEGITADLESMQRVGIGGAEIFNAGEGIPAGPVKFNS